MDTYVVQPTWVILLTLVGFISLAKFSASLIRFFYVYFLRPTKNLKSRYGPWAVVTGATDGIGEALAFQLAHQGLHLVLLGRNPDKLQTVTNALRQEYPTTNIKTVVFDLAVEDTKAGLRRLREEIEGLDVGVLFNNAGVSDGYGMLFDEAEVETWMKVIKVNVRSLTEVTRAVLPGMLERKRGAVVNIGSGAMLYQPSSNDRLAIYSATKAYIDQFSRSLYVEYKSRGIDVQCQIPSLVATRRVSEYLKVKWYNPFTAPLDAYARASMRWIGYEPRCLPYLPHFIEWVIFDPMPNFICNGLIWHAIMSPRKILEEANIGS